MGFRDLTGLRRHYAGQASQLVNEFYLPVLSQAVRYDRQAGYFDSASLVQLAAGLAAFIRCARDFPWTQTRMRVITGATWSPEDRAAYQRGLEALQESLNHTLVRHFAPTDDDCIRLGLPPGWRPQEDHIARHRLGALAWLVAARLMEVRIALPLDHAGRPYYPGRHGALYHPKAGILYDPNGDIVAFQGSVNETGAAWARNREKFEVKRSWYSEQDAEDIRFEIEEFEQIWNGRDPGLLVLPLPQAIHDHLRAFEPLEDPPEHDPLEIALTRRPSSLRDRLAAQWLLDAPTRPGGERLVLDPLWADGKSLTPFPHQAQVFRRVVADFPQSFLFCDEVGLGKTIEAGLALRALTLKGEVLRALIIAPRSLIRQWMEELREKFALTAWFFDGQCLQDVGGRVRWTKHPWEEDGIVIVSRHLVARSERIPDVVAANHPWDVVIVDEAHAARRRVFGEESPTLLLTLLQGLRAQYRYRSLWLLTATPMQIEAHEVHDLLLLCGLDDPSWQRWRDVQGFQRFFARLQAFPRDRQARTDVMTMTRLAVARGAPELNDAQVPQHWSPFAWKAFVAKVNSHTPGLTLALQQMTGHQAEAISPYLARQSPLAVYMFRSTRATLRAYQERGLVRGLATRNPEDSPVTFRTETERRLYRRIDELCSQFYRLADLAPDERSGVGFLMAVFRKRLASSFAAFQKSLERRRDLIVAIQRDLSDVDERLQQQHIFEEDEEEDDETDVSLVIDRERQRLLRWYHDPRRRERLEQERLYLQDYITALGQIAVDSKFEVFQEQLNRIVADGHRVIIFTQYLDTLDFIRDRLVARYGNQLSCYSGRGGEVWDAASNRWRVVQKAEVKARSERDHPQAITILLGTDAASEGLNLQQFSALINYDLPWNPMRVEQRIGRIDRIGQEAPVVNILNLYMEGTIEEDTYDTLKRRIGLFEEVVGPLQPILAEMPRIFHRLARGKIELAEARRQLDAAAREKPRVAIAALEECVRQDLGNAIPEGVDTALVTQEQLAAWCLGHPAPGMRILCVPEPGMDTASRVGTQGCLAITWADAPAHLGIEAIEEILATFSGELADRHPPTALAEGDQRQGVQATEGIRLLTWGDPYLTAWLEAIRGEPLSEDDYRETGLRPDENPL
jgi:superfamily II DNA/RNA helicase